MTQERHAKLKARLRRWKEAFDDPDTGIYRNLDDLIWKYAVFATSVRIVQHANARADGPAPLNQMLFELVADGFWINLLVGTRRLIDLADLSGDVGVYSLRSVLRDVAACQPKLTRRIYVEALRGAQYDTTRLREEQDARLWNAAQQRPPSAVWGDPEITKSEFAHADFDILSARTPDSRAENDKMNIAVLTNIEAVLRTLDDIGKHVSSHVAHAGNQQSREGRQLVDFDIRDARKALRTIKGVADLMGTWFANGSGAGLATFIGDQFEALDKPMIDSAGLAMLEENWAHLDQDISSWVLTPEELISGRLESADC